MRCTNCGTEASPGEDACLQCGQPLIVHCPSCATPGRLDALKCISSPDALVRAGLAACHAELGAAEAAAEERLATLALAPSFTIAECLATLHYRDPAYREHHRQSLERAGFPA